MSKWIRKGDKVLVLAGNEKGKTGTVLSRKGERVLIQGLNVRKKHVKRKTQADRGIIDIEVPIHVSNVAICNDEGKAVKIQVKLSGKGKKQLVYLENDKEVIYREVAKA